MTDKAKPCDRAFARERLERGREFMEVAAIAEPTADAAANVAISNYVLAGISASDALCCASLGRHNRSENHRDAVELLRSVEPEGDAAAKALGRLLSLKDKSQYGGRGLAAADLATARRQAARLIELAEIALAG